MENVINNLTYKNINDFTSEDTIYLLGGASDFPVTYLCKFVKFEKNRVHGIKIGATVNASIYAGEAGEEMSCRLEKAQLHGQAENEKRTRYHSFDFLGFACYENLYEKEVAELPTEHASYATVRFARINGGGGEGFFGASIKPNSYISLEISNAEIKRDLSHDWIHSRGNVVQLKMTESQFAELITSLNVGSGTPATFTYIGGNKIPNVPFLSKYEQHAKEFKNQMKEFSGTLKNDIERARTLLNSDKALNKKDKESLFNLIQNVLMQVDSNIPFYQKSYSEQMDKTVHEAKMQIEQFMQNRAKELGLGNVQTDDILAINENTEDIQHKSIN